MIQLPARSSMPAGRSNGSRIFRRSPAPG